MAADDHQQHAEGQHDDVGVLLDQVAQVQRREQPAVGRDLEEDHDRDQREQHRVFADVVLQELADPGVRALLQSGGFGGHCLASLGPISLERMIARMMFS
jgi:hypothetical protein